MLKRRILVSFLTPSIVAAIFFLHGKSPTAQYNNHTQSDQYNSVGGVEIQPIHDTETTQPHKKNADERITDWLGDVRLTDLLIVIFTGVLAWKTSGRYTETAALRTAADEQRQEMLRSIRAAEISANAATLAAHALQVIERAQLVEAILSNNFWAALRGIENPFATLSIKNYGKTPATIIDVVGEINISRTSPTLDRFPIGDMVIIERILAYGSETGAINIRSETLIEDELSRKAAALERERAFIGSLPRPTRRPWMGFTRDMGDAAPKTSGTTRDGPLALRPSRPLAV
jgi:hypothetical protein